MLHIIIDTLLDGLKILPFLFIAFLLIELIEHKLNNKTKTLIKKSGKFSSVIGSLLGLFPQCGFSIMATNFYITRVISIGTLFSVYLSTSDEMLIIMLSEGISFKTIFSILLIKFISGIVFGFIIDSFIRRKDIKIEYDYKLCEEEHCDCNRGIFKSSLKHTLSTLFFVIFISFVINVLFEYVGSDIIKKIFMRDNLFGPFIGSLIGLIPNCGASIALTELFLNNAINLGTCIAGLLTGSGVAIIILFKSNKNIRENVFIISTLYLIGVLVGVFVELMGILL